MRERNACFHSFFHHSLHYHSFFSLRSFFSLHSIPFHIFQGNVVKWKKKNVVRWMVCGVLFLFQLNARFIPFHCRLIKRNNTTQHRIRLLSPGDYRGSCGKWSMNGRRTNGNGVNEWSTHSFLISFITSPTTRPGMDLFLLSSFIWINSPTHGIFTVVPDSYCCV